MPKFGKPDEENPEWTKEDFKRSLRFHELPESLQKTLSAIQTKRRGPQKAPTKVLASLRLSPDVLEAICGLRAQGWQARADEALRKKFAKGKTV